jgi:hypothetical protein
MRDDPTDNVPIVSIVGLWLTIAQPERPFGLCSLLYRRAQSLTPLQCVDDSPTMIADFRQHGVNQRAINARCAGKRGANISDA